MLSKLTSRVIRHRWLVVSIWLIAATLGLFANSSLPRLLTTSLDVPGTGSHVANQALEEHFAQNIEGSFTIVAPLRGRSAASVRHALARAVAGSLPSATLTRQQVVNTVVIASVSTPDTLARASALTKPLRQALRQNHLVGALVTGPAALQYDITPILSSDVQRGEVIALLIAGLMLVLVLGWSLAAFIPLLAAAATVGVSLALCWLLAHWLLMVLYVPNVIELIGLGVSIDYALLIVHRFRHEHHDPAAATANTMRTAGRTVIVSALAVFVGLLLLVFVPVPFVRSLGVAGVIVPVVALAGAVTLQPALLAVVGERLGHRGRWRGLLAPARGRIGWWERWARFVVRNAVVVFVAATLGMLALGSSVWTLSVTPGSLTSIPPSMPSARALKLVASEVGLGAVTPDQVVIDSGRSGGIRSPRFQRDELRLARLFLADTQTTAVAIGIHPPFVDPTDRYAQIVVVGAQQFGDASAQALVHELRDVNIPRVSFPPGTTIAVGGAPAQGVDFLDRVYETVPWLAALALALAAILLARAFRSWLLGVLAVALDVLSIATALGVTVAVFRDALATRLLHLYPASALEGWVPVFVGAVLFGLSMDYEVFIMARTREAFVRTRDVRGAIVEGLGATGGVVTAAALILTGAFGGFVFGHVAGLQELGVALAVGVLLDATVVRAMILPAATALLQHRLWRAER